MPQETQTEPKRVRVFGPDNKYYSFPPGTTKETAISFFKKRGISSPESVATAPAKAPAVTAKPEPEKAPESSEDPIAHFARHALSGAGLPESINKVPEWWHHLTHDDALAPMKEAIHNPTEKTLVGAVPFIGPSATQAAELAGKGDYIGALGTLTGTIAPFVAPHLTKVDANIKAAAELERRMGASASGATQTAHKLTKGVPNRILKRRAFEDAYVHAKGLDVAKKVTKAVTEVDKEIKTHAEGIANEIDTKIPTGVVDAAAEAANIVKEFKDIVKAPEKVHPSLLKMVKDARATAPKLWSWEKARQFRSSIGRAIGKVEGPQKAVLTREYISLTKKLGDAAKKYGLEKSWSQYNELASKMDKQYADIVDDIKDAKSGEEVAKRLGRDPGITSEFVRNLSRYGLTHDEVMKFVKDSQRILKQRGFWNKTLFRLAYGSPVGAPVMILARLAGAPWMAGLGAGALIGLTSSYLVNLARVMKLSPDIIEHMMRERSLPGRMKFEKGQFPDEGTPRLPEGEPPTKPKVPPQLPTPKAEAKTEPTKVEPEKHGTGKLAEQAKARERVSKSRAVAKRTKESEAAEAQARAQAKHMDVSQLQIPELEEYVRTRNPTEFSGLQNLRKSKGITDEMYLEGLKYYALQGLEE